MQASSFLLSGTDSLSEAQQSDDNDGRVSAAEDTSIVETDESDDDGSAVDEPAGLTSPAAGDLLQGLRGWAGKHNISHAALDELLPILSNHVADLPKSSRSLLDTPRECPIRQFSGGEYVHFGLGKGLERCISSGFRVPNTGVLTLTLNIDGFPCTATQHSSCGQS